MTNYISLKSILSQIPKPLFNHSEEDDFLSWALMGLRESKIINMYEPKVKIFNLGNGVIHLPNEIKEINLVTYLACIPSEEDITNCQPCFTSTIPEESVDTVNSNYSISYKLFLDSDYYNKNFRPLQYKGNGSYICKNCPNKTTPCQYTYTVDSSKVLHTNLTTGYICVDYDSEVLDSEGEMLIPDFQELKQYLVYYSLAKHWEERAMMSEQNAYNLSQDYLTKAEIYLKKVKGSDKLRKIDVNSIAMIQGGQYQKLIKLPEQYVYAR